MRPALAYPAELMPRADKDLALDITWTGARYVAVGDRGHILVSNDANDWLQVPAPVRSALTSVAFADADNGWAVGHDATILHSADGGRTWEMQNFEPELEEPFHDVIFRDAQRGIAVGAYGLAYYTTDGGQQWQELDAPALRGDEYHINDVVVLNDGRLFAVGEYGLLATADDVAGPWRRLAPPYSSSLFGAIPVGESGALIFGLRGNVFVADDLQEVPDVNPDFDPVLGTGGIELSGAGWRMIETGTSNSMFGGVALDGGGYALVGLNGQVLTLDENANLVGSRKTQSESPLASAFMGPDGQLILAGEDGIEQLSQP